MISFRGILSKRCEQKISTRQRKPSAYFLPLEERHGQDEERAHEADRGGVRLIHIWWRRWESNESQCGTPVPAMSQNAVFKPLFGHRAARLKPCRHWYNAKSGLLRGLQRRLFQKLLQPAFERLRSLDFLALKQVRIGSVGVHLARVSHQRLHLAFR